MGDDVIIDLGGAQAESQDPLSDVRRTPGEWERRQREGAHASARDALANGPSPQEPLDEGPRLFRRWTMAELLAAPRTFEWRVRGLMAHPTHGMLAGAEKTLKTYVSMFVNLGVASGVSIFGHFEVDQSCPVMAYVGEGGRIPYTRRLERVAQAMGVDLLSIPLFPSFETAPVSSVVFRESLARDLREVQPGLVTMDPWYSFHGTSADARNLYDEGALLSTFSNICGDAGASLKIVNHNNQTGQGHGLRRITMAGAAEWCDSWWLVDHREPPDVGAGRFRLSLEIGSRQWGGSAWDLDLNLGPFNVERGEHDGEITWDLRRGERSGGSSVSTEDKVLEAVACQPWSLTKSDLIGLVTGKDGEIRTEVDRLVDDRRLVVREAPRPMSDGRTRKTWVLGPPQP